MNLIPDRILAALGHLSNRFFQSRGEPRALAMYTAALIDHDRILNRGR